MSTESQEILPLHEGSEKQYKGYTSYGAVRSQKTQDVSSHTARKATQSNPSIISRMKTSYAKSVATNAPAECQFAFL
ncbi:hypothetical protein BD779DRAFT_1622 [Infundibulicybe gibba]|nr:hypothetical protein BD779DRAFT_1622 [Infundibulicybe gibba]